MNKLRKFCVLSLLVATEIFGMQPDTIYRVVSNNAAANVVENLKQEEPGPVDLAVLTLAFQNYRLSASTGKSFNYEFLESVKNNGSQLQQNNISFYILILIDDKNENVDQELEDIVGAWKALGMQVPLYLMRNDGNLKIAESSKKLFCFINSHEMGFFCRADADDVLHKNLLYTMYDAMTRNDALVCSGDHTLLGVPDAKICDIVNLQNARRTSEDFEEKVSSNDPEDVFILWKLFGDNLMIFREFSETTWHTDGYLPVMSKKVGNIPTDIESTNLAEWIYCYLRGHPGEKYLTLVPKNDAFLYFYRLHENSDSHAPSDSIDLKEMTKNIVTKIISITNQEYAVPAEVILAQLVLNCSLNVDFNVEKIENENYAYKIAEELNMPVDFINDCVKAFSEIISMLQKNDVAQAKKACDNFFSAIREKATK